MRAILFCTVLFSCAGSSDSGTALNARLGPVVTTGDFVIRDCAVEDPE